MNKILQIGCILCWGVLLVQAKPLLVTGSSNHRAHEIGEVAAFSTLRVNGQIEVDVQQGATDEYAVSLYGPDNLIDWVQISSQGGVLAIQYKQPLVITGDQHLHVLVTTPTLTDLHVQEKGEVRFVGAFQTTELNVIANGKIEIDIEDLQAQSVRVEAKGEAEVDMIKLDCQSLHVETDQQASFEVQQTVCPSLMLLAENRSDMEVSSLTGQHVSAQSNHAANIELKGKTEQASLIARGHSSIQAGSLQADKAEVMAANGSYIDVRVSGTLTAQTDSRGVVQYRGWPREINRSGKGLVRKNS